jgi:hypothetical protein
MLDSQIGNVQSASSCRKAASRRRTGCGAVLLVTLVLLVVFSTIAYTVGSTVMMQQHRQQYFIDYQTARYGCDSAVKYAIATLEDLDPQLISRPNEPDFSDLFAMSKEEYKQLIEQWNLTADDGPDSNLGGVDSNDVNDVTDVNFLAKYLGQEKIVPVIRGPYGPVWPFVTEPLEFQIGSAKVKIEIEDENAKYPLCWSLIQQKDIEQEIEASLETFCEWMRMDKHNIDSLKLQLKKVAEIKPFKFDFKPVQKVEKVERTSIRSRRRSSRTPQSSVTKIMAPASVHTSDLAKLLHSPLLDTEMLANPTIVDNDRKESALKYLGIWASEKVNINTAPRNVLEAALIFGGDQVQIAEEIIKRRQIKPYGSVDDLKKQLFRYSDSIEKCKKLITTKSDYFTIRVTATSGVAKASAVIAVRKDGKKVEKIAVLEG